MVTITYAVISVRSSYQLRAKYIHIFPRLICRKSTLLLNFRIKRHLDVTVITTVCLFALMRSINISKLDEGVNNGPPVCYVLLQTEAT